MALIGAAVEAYSRHHRGRKEERNNNEERSQGRNQGGNEEELEVSCTLMLISHLPNFSKASLRSALRTFLEMFPTNRLIFIIIISSIYYLLTS